MQLPSARPLCDFSLAGVFLEGVFGERYAGICKEWCVKALVSIPVIGVAVRGASQWEHLDHGDVLPPSCLPKMSAFPGERANPFPTLSPVTAEQADPFEGGFW